MQNSSDLDKPITITIGRDEIIIRRRYEFASIANDFMVALWFLIGSFFFLYPSLEVEGTWLFVLGSFQLLIRPSIRLASHIHLQRIPPSNWES
jgi:hypothetical protein